MKEKTCQHCHEKEATCHHYLKWKKKKLEGDHRQIAKKHPEWFVHLCQECHDKVHGIEPRRGRMYRLIVELRKTQKARSGIGNQKRSLSHYDFKIPKHLDKITNICEEAEKEYDKKIKKLLDSGDYPIWPWLKDIKGISYRLAGKLIGHIDIFKTPKPSNLWQFCGYGDPKDRRRKGYKVKHNTKLKKSCYQIGMSFVKQRNRYRKYYDKTKEKELKRVTKNHAHMRALRIMIKEFLKDLYVEWRKAEGLEVSKTYAEAIIHGK